MFFRPIKNDGARLDFYLAYKEAAEYDTDDVNMYDRGLNAILVCCVSFITATCLTLLWSPLSAVGSAFVIDVHSSLQSDPNEKPAVLLHAILLTLNQSAIPANPGCSACPGRPAPRDHFRHRAHVRESSDLIVRRLHCDIGETVV
jgi:hypothetical protein